VDAEQRGQAVGGVEELPRERRGDRPAGPPVVTRCARTAVDAQLQEKGIAAIDEALRCTDSATPNSFAAISPGTSAAPARVAHLAWAVIVRATQADRSAPIQIRLLMSSSFRRGTCAPA